MNKKCILNQMPQQLKEYTKKIDFSKCTDKNDIIMSFNKSITNLYEDFYGKEFIDNWEVVSEIKDDTLKTGLRSKKPIECIDIKIDIENK